MDLIRSFDGEQYLAALESWAWVPGLEGLSPVFTSAFGDVVLGDPDGAFWYLDLASATLTREWPDGATLEADLDVPQQQERFLRYDLVVAAARRDLTPDPTQVLGYVVPPVLGGALVIDNVEVSDFVVSVNLLGQVHERVKNVPPGTRIAGFDLQ